MRHLTKLVLATALVISCFAASGQVFAHEVKIGSLIIHHPWTRQSPKMAGAAAGFMIITNTGKEDDRLLKATSELSGTTQIHDMKMENDVMKMFELPDGIIIPAGKSVELKPGSTHIMFMELKSQAPVNSMVKGTLVFEKAGTADVEFEVTEPDAGMN